MAEAFAEAFINAPRHDHQQQDHDRFGGTAIRMSITRCKTSSSCRLPAEIHPPTVGGIPGKLAAKPTPPLVGQGFLTQT